MGSKNLSYKIVGKSNRALYGGNRSGSKKKRYATESIGVLEDSDEDSDNLTVA